MADNNRMKEQLKEITERLEQGIQEVFESEKYKEYLNTMSKFYNYSFNNTLLIAMQKPESTLIAGYQAWQNKFERHVKRGEKGIRIIAPAVKRHAPIGINVRLFSPKSVQKTARYYRNIRLLSEKQQILLRSIKAPKTGFSL